LKFASISKHFTREFPLMKKYLLFYSILLTPALLLLPFCLHTPENFTPSLLVQDINLSTPSQGCEILATLTRQPFSYLGKGSQAIAFESSDHLYVIKFFLKKPLYNKWRIRSPFYKAPHPRIRWNVLTCYATVFEKIPEETALIGLHLSANTSHLPKCCIQDPKGHLHTLDLNRFSFLLQKKCAPLTRHSTLSSQQQKSLETLLSTLASKGFKNQRSSFKEVNFAFLDDQAFLIDAGNFVFEKTQLLSSQHEVARSQESFRRWVCR